MSKDLHNVVVEQLIDSKFVPGTHEAYAWVSNTVLPGRCRISGYFARMIDQLEWDDIEKEVKKAKSQIHD